MSKTKISEYSTTPANNTDIDGVNIAEGCAPSGINNAIRTLMSHVKEWQSGSSGDPFTVTGAFVASSTANFSGAVTFSGNVVSSGSNTLSGSQVISGNINSSGNNTFSGSNTFSGNTVLSAVTTFASKGGSNTYTTSLTFTQPTTFRTVTFPDKTGTVAMTSDLPSNTTLTTSSGTYSISGTTTLTISLTSHGRSQGDVVYLNFTSGDAVDGNYTIATIVNANSFTITHGTSITTSGNVTVSYSNKGLVELISTDEARVGTSTSKALTAAAALGFFTGDNQSLSANGYQKLPGGVILLWGTWSSTVDTSQSVTFHTPFPNNCWFVTTEVGNANIPSKSTTGFNVDRPDGVTGTQTISYFAVGN